MIEQEERAALVERLARAAVNVDYDGGGAPAADLAPNDEDRAVIREILAVLDVEGRLADPSHDRCRHHDGFCGHIVQANEALGVALKQARSDSVRLLGVLDRVLAASGLAPDQEALWRAEAGGTVAEGSGSLRAWDVLRGERDKLAAENERLRGLP